MAGSRVFDKKRNVLTTSGAVTTTWDIPVPSDTVIGFVAKITANESATHLGLMIYQTGAIQNNAGTVALSGTVASLASVINAGLAGAAAAFTANGTNLRLTVTGVVLLDITWQIEIELINN